MTVTDEIRLALEEGRLSFDEAFAMMDKANRHPGGRCIDRGHG